MTPANSPEPMPTLDTLRALYRAANSDRTRALVLSLAVKHGHREEDVSALELTPAACAMGESKGGFAK